MLTGSQPPQLHAAAPLPLRVAYFLLLRLNRPCKFVALPYDLVPSPMVSLIIFQSYFVTPANLRLCQAMRSLLPRRRWTSRRSEDQDAERKQTKGSQAVRAITVFLRGFGLQIFSALLYDRSPIEPAKVAIHKSLLISILRLVVHVIPLAAALTLVGLNTQGVLVPDYSWFSGLQFVAKLHEIFMQASLAAIVMAYLRHQALTNKSLPFGSMFSGLQVSSLGYLWSLEFMGTLSAPWMPIWKRLKLGMIIIIAIALAASVGPSSAILMIPRQTEIFYSAGSREIDLSWFPSNLNSSKLVDPSFP
jgi:hypothetical protein